MQKHYEKWNAMAPLGLLVIGLGLTLTGDAILRKTQSKPWVLQGAIGLFVFNIGVSIFGDSVKERALYEMELKNHNR